MGKFIKYYPLLLLLFISNSYLQGKENEILKIKGYVYNSITLEPLIAVNVFIANSYYGATTDKNGFFILENIPYSTFTLVFQHVGYSVKNELVNCNREKYIKISLQPKSIQMEGIAVYPDRNLLQRVIDKYKRQIILTVFLEKFLGKTENAKLCEVINPETLHFNYDKNCEKYSVSADTLLIVKNYSLGYTVSVAIKNFKWVNSLYFNNCYLEYYYFLKYQEMFSSDSVQLEKWRNDRRKTYLGSCKHLFYTLSNDSLNNKYFKVYKAKMETKEIIMNMDRYDRGQSVKRVQSLKKVDNCNIYDILSVTNYVGDCNSLKVPYNIDYVFIECENLKESFLELKNKEIFFDGYGNFLDGNQVIAGGEWAKCGVADFLPKEYLPK